MPGRSRAQPSVAPAPAPAGWTFLSNHAHVLICLAETPDMTLRAVANRVGITERAVQRIVTDLEDAGVLLRRKRGRQNVYAIHRAQPLRHPVESHRTVGDLLAMVHDPDR